MISPRRNAVVLALLPLLLAAFEAQHWRYRRPVRITTPAAMARVRIDTGTYRLSSNHLADLRVVRDGIETPFVLETSRARHIEREYAGRLDKVLIPGKGLQLTVDLNGSPRHNQVRIETPLRNFKERAVVSASADRTQWDILRDDASIFDDSESDRPSSSLAINYPATDRRYVRLTIPGWNELKAVSGMWVRLSEDIGARRETILTVDRPAATQQDQRSSYELDFRFSGIPHDLVALEVAPGSFLRSVQVTSSDDKKHWHMAGSGTIARDTHRDNDSVQFAEQWDRYLRIELFNRDDQPLTLNRIRVQGIVRQLHFQADKPGQYWLYLGNPEGIQPVYDLASVWRPENTTMEPAASLGPQQPNPAYKMPEKPLSDQYPAVLYVLLISTILGMGYLAIRLLRRLQDSSLKT